MAVALLLAAVLPLQPHPAAPFPAIRSDAATVTSIAPGIEYAEYDMRTSDGPLAVRVLSVNPHARGIRFGSALANDRLVSPGETLSSMARRSGAVAGVNADYFDINQTNQPLNLLVENGAVLHPPMMRPVFAVTDKGDALISDFSYAQTAHVDPGEADAHDVPLGSLNDWAPRGSHVVLITPVYGPLHAAPGVTLIPLQPSAPSDFRASDPIDASTPAAPGYYLAAGPDEPPDRLPAAGERVTITSSAQPSLDHIVSAVGGGPLLVQNGAPYVDPHGPSTGEFATHMPASGAALRADGTVLLFEIDGRAPETSIGVLQPQFAALMVAFGAQTGMQFDGGGSSTMVARLPGSDAALVLNAPSDGSERRIADALLVYSDLPRGKPVAIATDPQAIRAVPGADVTVRAFELDDAGHTLKRFAVSFRARAPRREPLLLERDGLRVEIPVEVGAPARLEITPLAPVAAKGGTLKVSARAFDAAGYPMSLPVRLPWSAQNANVSDDGTLHVGERNAIVRVAADGAAASSVVVVGRRAQPLPFAASASFATAPPGRAGTLTPGELCAACVGLHYDFTADERAAYADVQVALPQRALGIEADVYGDGNGETLRAAVDNAIRERFLFTLARIDWRGWRTVTLRFPPGLPQPVVLRSLYVVAKLGTQAAAPQAGSVVLRNVRVVLAGSGDTASK